MPAQIVLAFIDLTGASPRYLLRCGGARYSSDSALGRREHPAVAVEECHSPRAGLLPRSLSGSWRFG
jgi:hypothetical protein